jgi:hypothetical protein
LVPEATGFSVERGVFNRVEWTPVQTDALRLEVRLKDGKSAGLHEWRVAAPR